MSLTPRDLDYFLEIARCGQLAQAATQQKVTAAAMSKAVRRLEDEVGLPLFERTGHGMMLTPFGVSFQERALRIKSEHDEALRHAGDVLAGRAGLLRIGATLAVINGFVSPALAHLQPRRPGMHVRLSPPVAAIEVDVSSSWSLSLLAGTDLLTMAPRSALFGSGGCGVRELGYQGLCLSRTIAACWRMQAYRSPLANEFVAALKASDPI